MQMKGKFTWRRIEQSSEKKLFYVQPSRKLPLFSLVLLLARDEKKFQFKQYVSYLLKYHDYSVSKQVLVEKAQNR